MRPRFGALASFLAAQGRHLDIGGLVPLGLGELISRIATFFAFVHLARILAPAGYGQVELTLAAMAALSLLVDQGLGTLGTREIARDPNVASSLASRIITVQILLALTVTAATLIIVHMLPLDAKLRMLVTGYSFSLFGFPFLLQWVFQGLKQMNRATLPQVVRWLLFAGLVLLLVRKPGDVLRVPVIEFLSVGAAGALFYWLFVRSGHRFVLDRHRLFQKSLLKESLPIGGSQFIWALRMYLPTLMLGFLSGQAAVGLFGAAHRILMAVQTLLNVYFINLFPTLTARLHSSPEQTGSLLRVSLLAAGGPSVLLAFATPLAAPAFVHMVFGENYSGSEATTALSLLIWLIPVFVLRRHARLALIAMGQQRAELNCSILGLLVMVGLGVPLMRNAGPVGAAWAMLVSETLSTILAWVVIKHYWTRLESCTTEPARVER